MGAVFVVNQPLAPTNSTNNVSVNVNITSVQLLAENTSRLGSTIYNDSLANLYVLLGVGTASNTTYTVLMVPGAYYETPYNYNGAIQGIWDSSTSGAARLTELI